MPRRQGVRHDGRFARPRRCCDRVSRSSASAELIRAAIAASCSTRGDLPVDLWRLSSRRRFARLGWLVSQPAARTTDRPEIAAGAGRRHTLPVRAIELVYLFLALMTRSLRSRRASRARIATPAHPAGDSRLHPRRADRPASGSSTTRQCHRVAPLRRRSTLRQIWANVQGASPESTSPAFAYKPRDAGVTDSRRPHRSVICAPRRRCCR